MDTSKYDHDDFLNDVGKAFEQLVKKSELGILESHAREIAIGSVVCQRIEAKLDALTTAVKQIGEH